MFDQINGLPLHPLVVHAVVVLLPLAALGTLAIAVRPAWRLRYGHLVVACAALAAIACPIATSSGEALERRVGDPGLHTGLGDTLVWFALALTVLSLALVVLERRRASEDAPVRRPWLPTVVAVVALVVALGTGVQVYRVGDTGAQAVWGDTPAAQG